MDIPEFWPCPAAPGVPGGHPKSHAWFDDPRQIALRSRLVRRLARPTDHAVQTPGSEVPFGRQTEDNKKAFLESQPGDRFWTF